MCHDDTSRPPAAPGSAAAGTHGEIGLIAADGNSFAAYAALPAAPADAGVVILPDVRGLHAFYRDLAVRFAEAGMPAVAIDYFGRTAGTGDRSGAFEYMPHVQQTTPEGVAADVAAAVAHLRSPDGGAVTSVFTVGFCFGGAYSWRQSADTPGLAGAVGFYGRPERAAEVAGRMTAPLLMLMGGADQGIPVAGVERFADDVPVEATLVVYEGAPHSFFDRAFADHADACADAWTQITAFVRRDS
ncbi:MAG: dienelactone hydrolase family protein [Actinomycetota bacterium]|nr:dienelactone hydrolase family protein [Actinomycetota bacterium]